MSTAIAGKKLSTKRAEWDVRQRARQIKAHPDCRSTTIKLPRPKNIPCVIVGPRQSSSRRDRRNGHPDCRCVPIQIDALQLVLGVSAATIDRLLVETKIPAAGGKRRRVGFYSAVRREVPIRTFNDWHDPPPGFCEVDMVAHGGTSGAGSFIQTVTMVDVATGWTECMPLVTRESGLVVRAMERAQSLFPWLIRGADFDNDSAFMNDVVVPWCRAQKIEVTRSRAYKKNDQAFVEQKNGAVVRRLMGYGRFDGLETTRVLERLYAASRLHTNFFQPSFKLKDKRREGAKVIKRYHVPATPYARALAHPKLSKAVKRRLREIYRPLDPVALPAERRDVT